MRQGAGARPSAYNTHPFPGVRFFMRREKMPANSVVVEWERGVQNAARYASPMKAVLFAGFALAIVPGAASTGCGAADDRVRTANGVVEGVADENGVRVF